MRLVNKDTVSAMLTRMERLINLTKPSVTILAYHAISTDKTIVDVDPSLFQQQIEILKNNCEFITLDQAVNFIQGKETFTAPAVALTFDDGYEDIFSTVLPILHKEHINASVFALSNSSNPNRRELENNKKLLTTAQLQMLHTIGWTVGCHSATHAYFGNRQLDKEKEIIDAKEQLENDLKVPVKYFAYPKGIYSPAIVETVKQAGFQAAFAFESGFISQKTNLFTIPRMPVDWTHTDEQFRAFFTNWGVRYLQTKQSFEKKFLSI